MTPRVTVEYEQEQRDAFLWLHENGITLQCSADLTVFSTLSWECTVDPRVMDLGWAVAIARKDFESYDRTVRQS